MNAPLMPKATAVWLIDNTTLTFEQIADFCHLHTLEVQAIADGEIIIGMVGHDPVSSGQLTVDEIERCQSDPHARLQMSSNIHAVKTKKGAKYTPVALRQVKPNGIAWLLREVPTITDGDIIRLLG
ncbi:MAG: cell cycle transcriptional regulator TrcR, partial [Alphaproteobacteria bacterium]|nr:cell cycle transcriptional regulator TrcR [Alphaproteobacteria bacterium]